MVKRNLWIFIPLLLLPVITILLVYLGWLHITSNWAEDLVAPLVNDRAIW